MEIKITEESFNTNYACYIGCKLTNKKPSCLIKNAEYKVQDGPIKD